MVSAREFIDGVRINWRRLSATIVFAGIFAWFEGVVAVILSLADLPIALISGLTNFYGELAGVVLGFPSVLVNQGFAATVPYVVDAGPAGFLFALVVVLATFYPIAWVISNVR